MLYFLSIYTASPTRKDYVQVRTISVRIKEEVKLIEEI